MYRKTTDLDIHCDKRDVWIDFYTNIESILNSNNIGYVYRITDRRSQRKGFDRYDSIKFNILDTNCNKTIVFKIDININSNTVITCDYSPILNMTTYDALTMLSDKITVVSSQKIYRRIKDLYDLCVIVSLHDFTYYDVIEHIRKKHSGVKLEDMLISDNFSSLEHAFSKYEGISNKPNIMTIIALAKTFLQPIYCSNKVDMLWKKEISAWVSS